MSLLVGDHTFNVAHVRPGECSLRNPLAVAPQAAELVIRVDDTVYRRAVYLVDGIRADSRDVRLRDC